MRLAGRVLTAVTIGAALSLVLGATPARAACTTTAQCDANHVCLPSAIPGISECRELRCNANSDCPAARPTCTGGACRSLASTPTPGGGLSQSDVGGPCGQVRLGQVTKTIGCKAGLVCKKVPPSAPSGTCQRPAA